MALSPHGDFIAATFHMGLDHPSAIRLDLETGDQLTSDSWLLFAQAVPLSLGVAGDLMGFRYESYGPVMVHSAVWNWNDSSVASLVEWSGYSCARPDSRKS